MKIERFYIDPLKRIDLEEVLLLNYTHLSRLLA